MSPGLVSNASSRTNPWPPNWPPVGETPEEREVRELAEVEARRVSDAIDHSIDTERRERHKNEPAVKILLLGQAESGKSTLLKNFQLCFTPQAFCADLEAWGVVIRLNVCRAVSALLDALGDENGAQDQGPSSHGSQLRQLRMRLTPLRGIAQTLEACIAAAAETPASTVFRGNGRVRAGSSWKLGLLRKSTPQERTAVNDVENAKRILEACVGDICALWQHPTVYEALRERRVVLEDESLYFLNQVERIAMNDYVPSTDDVLRARLETHGVEEHHLQIEGGLNTTQDWVVYDVGGARRLRTAWAPFFDTVTSIVFLAPISAFNQTLAEDPTVNRLWDSYDLWKKICGNRLLASVALVLLLNKRDVLAQKLANGVKVSRFVTSFPEDGPNDVEYVADFFRKKFRAIAKHSEFSRNKLVYTHVTCAIDTTGMRSIISEVREVVLVRNLNNANIL